MIMPAKTHETNAFPAGGGPVPFSEHWLSHRVSYGETDAMGQVYYAEFLAYFERARSHYIREQGMSYAEVETRGIYLPVREAQIRYRAPARYDELIWIRAGICRWTRASLIFAYEIYDEAKERVLTTGSTQHACVNAQARPVAVPDWLRALG